MRIDDALWPYLTGEKFSNGHRVRFQAESSDSQYITRQAWLCSHLAGKRVVHIGCVDHDIGQVRHKRQRGKWLHGALLEASARVLGVDIDAAGIEKLRDEFGMQDLLAAEPAGRQGRKFERRRYRGQFIRAERRELAIVPQKQPARQPGLARPRGSHRAGMKIADNARMVEHQGRDRRGHEGVSRRGVTGRDEDA